MKITILTLFKDVYSSYLNSSIIKRAIDSKLVDIEVIDYREYSKDKHKKVDDYQFGGGPGMVLGLDPIVSALKDVKTPQSKVLLTTPSGKLFNQTMAHQLAQQDHIIMIAGHYEGFDARIAHYVDEQVSIGDYVLTGGELAAGVIADAIVRLIPGVISDEQSALSDSFQDNLLAAPVYTRPAEYKGWKVPDVLLSGHEAKIRDWEFQQSLERTKRLRPDLLEDKKKR